MTAQVAADLRAAADLLERHGWSRDKFYDEMTGCYCVAGALSVVTAPGVFAARWREALDALSNHVGLIPWPTSVYRWNDAPERTADEVIAALRAAADRAEADL